MSWHLDRESLMAYSAGEASETIAFSVEAHLPNCEECADRLAGLTGGKRLTEIWSLVAEGISSPVPSPIERALHRLGLPDYLSRLLLATPGLRVAAVLAVLGSIAFAGLADRSNSSDAVMLLLAPLVPLISVAVVFGAPRPAEEIDRAVPLSGLTIVLLRAIPVVGVALVIALGAQALIPGLTDPRWLVPAMALSFSTLALTRWVPVSVAGCGVSVAWLTVTVLSSGWSSGGSYEALARSEVFSTRGQVAAAALLVVALLTLVHSAASGRSEALR